MYDICTLYTVLHGVGVLLFLYAFVVYIRCITYILDVCKCMTTTTLTGKVYLRNGHLRNPTGINTGWIIILRGRCCVHFGSVTTHTHTYVGDCYQYNTAHNNGVSQRRCVISILLLFSGYSAFHLQQERCVLIVITYMHLSGIVNNILTKTTTLKYKNKLM